MFQIGLSLAVGHDTGLTPSADGQRSKGEKERHARLIGGKERYGHCVIDARWRCRIPTCGVGGGACGDRAGYDVGCKDRLAVTVSLDASLPGRLVKSGNHSGRAEEIERMITSRNEMIPELSRRRIETRSPTGNSTF